MARFLVSEGAEIRARANQMSAGGCTPLLLAAQAGHADCCSVRILPWVHAHVFIDVRARQFCTKSDLRSHNFDVCLAGHFKLILSLSP